MAIEDFYRGDTKKYTLAIKHQSTGAPISIHDGVLTYTLKLKQKDTTPALQVVTPGVESDPQVPLGVIHVVVPKDLTKLLVPEKEYFYDFEFVAASGEVTTVLAGTVNVLYDITV